MTRSILPPDRWHELQGTELEHIWPHLPKDASVVVVEDDGQIVGCWALFTVLHAEGVYIHPAHRGQGIVARMLLRGMAEGARARGARTVMTAAMTEDVADYARRVGGMELPGQHFILTIDQDASTQGKVH